LTTFFYDPAGRLTSRVDPRGNVAGAVAADFTWVFTYDAAGRQKTVTDATGRVTTTVYDALGRVDLTTRPDGFSDLTYDAAGNVIATASEQGSVSQTFDALNRVDTSTDLRGKVSSFGFDLASNRVQVSDPLLRVSKYTFDPDGRMSTMTDARGTVAGAVAADFTSTYLYDEAGHQVQVTDNLGRVSKQVYDRVGNVVTSTNAKALNTTFTYDTMNRVSRVTAPVVGATNYTYTPMGYPLTRTDPLSTATAPRISSWVYDQGGRLKEKKDAAARKFTYDYDVAGNMTAIVDANANAAGNAALGTTTMTYDTLNRLKTKSYSDGTAPVTYTYDAVGRLFTMGDAAGGLIYQYDAQNRVFLSIGENESRQHRFTYDEAGNVLTRSITGVNSSATYDDAGQLTSVTDSNGAYGFEYDRVGNLTKVTYPGGVSQTRSYDRVSQLSSIANAGPTGSIGGFNYLRDLNGNPLNVDVAGPSGVIATESMRNTYDNADRLTKTCFTTTTCAAANQSTWSYNAVGSRLTEKVGSAAVATYTYDVADQLTAITGPGAAGFTYNANGDQLTAGSNTFTYNTARQTKSATVGGVTTTFSYDGNGNRFERVVGGVQTLEEVDTVGGLPMVVREETLGSFTDRKYTYGPGGMLLGTVGYDGPTAVSTTGSYLTDGLGSVTNITTFAGTVGATYRYNPYGTSRAATSVLPAFAFNPMRYTGQQLDPTGNYNLRARQYNPSRGSFTQTDPMPLGAGSAFEGSYVYAGARPTVMSDPNGMRFGVGGYRVPRNQVRTQTNVDFDAAVPEDSDPNSEASCEARFRDKVQGMDDLTAGFAILWRTASNSCKSFVKSVAKFRNFNNRLGLAVAPDYFDINATLCWGGKCGSGALIWTRYGQWRFAADWSVGGPVNAPRHMASMVRSYDGGVRAGYFDRQIDPDNEQNDSALIDAMIQNTTASASGSFPTGRPVNLSIQLNANRMTGKATGIEIGLALPGPPSIGLSVNVHTWELQSPSVKRLW
jgi:RHS repeat-associated protein